MQTEERVWSTAGNRDAFAHWREVVCQAFTKLSPERLDERPFAGEIRLSAFGECGTLSEIRAGAQKVLRGKRDVEDRPCDAVFVNIQMAGSSAVRQCGMEARLEPGSFVMLDARRPFDMQFEGPFRQVCMHLPIELLEAQGFDPAGAVARTVGRDQVFGAALFDSVDDILSGEASEGSRDYLVQLLQLSLSGGRADTLADRHLKLVKHYVVRHCADSDLTPAVVAEHFRMSLRYLHKLFARSGTTFGRFVLRCRLRRARIAVLVDPQRPLLDIGLACGFQSASHFTRCFRREFGMTPGAMRRLV